MNKTLKDGALLTITIVILSAVLMGAFTTAHQYLRSSSPVYNFLFSPDDLYQTLSESAIDLSSSGLVVDLEFTAKYPGTHRIYISVDSPLETTKEFYSELEMKISIVQNGNIILESILDGENYWFLGGKKHTLIMLNMYKAPRDFLLDQLLVAKIEVIKSSPGYLGESRSQPIAIGKFSDE